MYTPGPWRIREPIGDLAKHVDVEPTNWPESPEALAICVGADRNTNARLIASAPDLLETLEGSLQYLIAWRFEYADKPNDEHNNAQRDRIDQQVRKVETAIAKARSKD